MKKLLLLLFGIYFSLTLFSQNSAITKKATGFKNGQSQYIPEENISTITGVNTPVRISGAKHQVITENTMKVAAAATKFTSSMNVFGVLNSTSKPLQFTPNVNIISFIHRKSPTYVTSPFSNSGSVVGMISSNNGISWDSTCVWTNTTSIAARYPQGGIYNPLGNTNKNNAYLIGCGPLMDPAIGWTGNFYSSKSLNGAGTPTPGIDQQAHLNASPTIKKHSLSMHSFSSIEGGFVRSMGLILNDPNSNNPAIFGLRGAAMTKGQFNAGAFVWSVDSFIPCVMSKPGGGKYLNEKVLQAWDESGTIGYVVLLGVSCGANPCQQSYQPIVYKTTNSGSTWALLPQTTFLSPVIRNRIATVNTNSNLAVPYFDVQEGWDATVDNSGALHIAATVVGAYSSHPDSLDYIYTFGPQQYKHAYGGSFGYPTLYDFKCNSIGSWGVMTVDSMGTEFVPATEPSNPWINGMFGKFELGARIQMSRSVDGKRIFYSWTESDSTIVGAKWNIYPDIKMKSFDNTTFLSTNRFNVTTGTNADQQSYFHFMSPKASGNSSSCNNVPLTITTNSILDGSLPVQHYYIDHASFCSSTYTVPTSSTLYPAYYPLTSGCNVVGLTEDFDGKSQISVYPNPSNGLFFIQGEKEKINQITIMDYLGRKVFEESNFSNDNSMTINLDNFTRGVYYITVRLDNNLITEKLILQ